MLLRLLKLQGQIMDSIKSMFDLQEIDSKLDKLNNNIQKINEELANNNNLNIAQNKNMFLKFLTPLTLDYNFR